MLRWLNKGADGLISLSALVGTLGLLVEVVVILTDVVGRYFGKPLSGAQDITQMAMVIVVFGGMALCDKIGGHISVDIFETSMPNWMIRAGDIVSALLGALIFFGIAWTTWASIAQMRGFGIILSTNIIGLPFDWFKGAIIVMSVITGIGMSLRAIALILGLKPVRKTA
ncbi:TRAP transporter small permease [Maritimibacter sp. HL-12]|uniref:TRAP transporter small permease n=1 Tax=Maritimibacter sp. HL-12 TaxID=1162418 RepID=UPI000A0F36D3|nr:TRAP transporter small permease [Maritimibacter sp. HL-12]SMH41932.1 TRAP-type C4-dicarboxylate transport system, small permease component [Maritimibacter sp. HL-12]